MTFPLYSLLSLIGFIHFNTPSDKPNTAYQNAETNQIEDCIFEDIELFGKVKFVDSSPDIKIQFVTSFPDIKVKFVSSFPNDCGEWKVVDSFPDFKVQVVERSADIKVKVVHSFPGEG